MAHASSGSGAFDAFLSASAGAGGGMFAAAMLMPVEIAKTRISVSQKGETTILGTMRQVVEKDGLPGLFSGVSVKCFEKGTENFVFFYVYEALKKFAAERQIQITNGVSLCMGFLAGIVTMTSINPLEVLSTKLQVGTARGPLSLLRLVVSKDGLAGLFTGYWFNLLLCSNPAIQNTVFVQMQEAMMQRKLLQGLSAKVSLTSLEVFMLGALAKAIATIITFPVTRMKTMLQAGPKPVDEADCDNDATLDALPRNFSFHFNQKVPVKPRPSEQFFELYRGLWPTLMKGVLQAALMYVAKDQVTKLVVMCLRGISRKPSVFASS
ncbi:SLC25A17 [Symbiodinium sp. CCMP2592]|nr:SLC25A17 [Symbiodinium sp. CCMP2592]